MPGSYGEPHTDPTHGVARWRHRGTPRPSVSKDPNRLPRGANNTREYDEKYGRWWYERKEEYRPTLLTTIGRHARAENIRPSIRREVVNTPNYKRLLRDPYRKRWPKIANLGVLFFAEFWLKEFHRRTLLETASTLPLDGVGCKFWRAGGPDSPDTSGKFIVASSVEFKQRPIRGSLRGTQYFSGRAVRHDIEPVGKTLGCWRYEFPEGAHPSVYRRPFPELLAAARGPDRGAASSE